MAENIGVSPKFNPKGIRDPMVKGLVNSAIRHAMEQKKPSNAVKEFSKDLRNIDHSKFEEIYGVPAARLKHQTRSRYAGEILEETRIQLEKLAADLEKAEGYWDRIFAHVASKYFKRQKGRICKELENARWHPYLAISYIPEEKALLRKPDAGYMYDYAMLTCFFPTDEKQLERYERLEKNKKLDHKYGWAFIREAFRTEEHKGVRMNFLALQNIQKVKIKEMLGQRTGIPKPPKEMMDNLRKIRVQAEVFSNEKTRKLLHDLELHHTVLSLVAMNAMAMPLRKLLMAIDELDKAIAGLEKEGLENECREIKAWRAQFPSPRALQKESELRSPQSVYPLDFLPMALAAIYAIEKNNPEDMERISGIIIDTTSPSRCTTSTGLREHSNPKELEGYIRLAETIGAERIREDIYMARSG